MGALNLIYKIIFSLLIISISITFSCVDDREQLKNGELQNIVFMAGYKAQSNLPFVGVYVAEQQGYFNDQGLNVDIKHSAVGEHIKLLLSGDVQFSTSDAGSILKQISNSGAPLTAIALLGHRGQQGYMTLKDSKIESLKDWEDKTFGFKISLPTDYVAMIEAENVDRQKIQEVNVGFDPRILTEGKVDILAVFKSNEPDTIRSLGYEVTVWDPYDYDVPTLGLTYITTLGYAENNPETVSKFLKATLKGIQFAIDNPNSAIEAVMVFAPESNIQHQTFMLNMEIKDAISEYTLENGIGTMLDAQWELLYEHLLKYNALEKEFNYKDAFRMESINKIYESGNLIWP